MAEAAKPDDAQNMNGDQPPAPIHDPAAVAAVADPGANGAEKPVAAVTDAGSNGAPPPAEPASSPPATEEPAEPAAPVTAAAPDYKSQLLDSLGLPDAATDEQISQAIEAEKEIVAAAQNADVDDLLAGYEIPDETKNILRETLVSDRAKGEALLSAMPKKAAVAGGADSGKPAATVQAPPAPTHTPPGQNGAQKAVSAEEKVTHQNALIKEIQGAGKFSDYSQAREEARRRKPELFS